ncbi:MAG: helix-turn-helix domain-containing protein [Coprobacillus cateniformis]
MINNFGGIIKLNRIQQGLTLDYISYKTGISKSQISRIERNKEQITFENVVKIFSVMNIEVSNENFETQFEKDFQTFYSDVVYVKDIENSYKVIRSYSDKI